MVLMIMMAMVFCRVFGNGGNDAILVLIFWGQNTCCTLSASMLQDGDTDDGDDDDGGGGDGCVHGH